MTSSSEKRLRLKPWTPTIAAVYSVTTMLSKSLTWMNSCSHESCIADRKLTACLCWVLFVFLVFYILLKLTIQLLIHLMHPERFGPLVFLPFNILNGHLTRASLQIRL